MVKALTSNNYFAIADNLFNILKLKNFYSEEEHAC
jgi:hypothetical protein